MTAAEQITDKLQALENKQILEIVEGLKDMATDEADIVIGAALFVLELRIPTGLYSEADFLELCDTLAA